MGAPEKGTNPWFFTTIWLLLAPAKPKAAAAKLKMREAITKKKLSDLTDPVEIGGWIRTYANAHGPQEYHTFDPSGRQGSVVRNTPTKADIKKGKTEGKASSAAWRQSASATGSAVSCLLSNGNRDVISEQLGEQHKVRSFYNNILDPDTENGDVTIDTHAVGAALISGTSGSDVSVQHNFGSSPEADKKPKGFEATSNSAITGLQGNYAIYADAYREAAAKIGILPHELQAAVWVEKRKMFGKGSEASAIANSAWKEYNIGTKTLEQTRSAIWAARGKEDD